MPNARWEKAPNGEIKQIDEEGYEYWPGDDGYVEPPEGYFPENNDPYDQYSGWADSEDPDENPRQFLAGLERAIEIVEGEASGGHGEGVSGDTAGIWEALGEELERLRELGGVPKP